MKDFSYQSYDCIIFDCDSTICAIEGIDELANLKGKKKEVEFLTQKAMDGELGFEEVFEKRLEIIKPHQEDLKKIGKMYINSLVKDMPKVIETLQYLGKEIYIITGGYEEAVMILAKELKISSSYIYANKLYFDDAGNYLDYERENHLCKNNGKKKLLQKIIQKTQKSAFIGDSMTDYEAKESVTCFIGYGGVARRESVRKKAKIFIESESMVGLLPHIIGKEDYSKLIKSKYFDFYQKGLSLFYQQNIIFNNSFDTIANDCNKLDN
ncbi:hypothetical protein A2X44_01460 [candidate division CPR3 bacterium GWF2_35_18]|uniref:phosphoserine phosphatase n=1 Tax=candidate division CPR3 bacterium GW2011_GWF2_35_18 TaxID=1618350 RepID=A0A0G0EST3_UNCC3|nr:MAG: HAD-superfamily hydrolase, subfamily IB (PSPase-like) [candidate division CPR3 bacterium GW2011_GWF2_35_18]OGB63570.1 MAG: hypothetical protein A2X44_01460 [candidate division CPR3 bacterium GWF2_35_18]OGB64679.1 MAG: hypothetical protein A2250_04010 [candidate division CPR3 bacterium RIFOXYA2_FULL_35_13]OGB79074.1 MAG: hypothetical protein A2296_00560 [candidate division CPR3 bacterium RIFOXYB2_FULL_35_8]